MDKWNLTRAQRSGEEGWRRVLGERAEAFVAVGSAVVAAFGDSGIEASLGQALPSEECEIEFPADDSGVQIHVVASSKGGRYASGFPEAIRVSRGRFYRGAFKSKKRDGEGSWTRPAAAAVAKAMHLVAQAKAGKSAHEKHMAEREARERENARLALEEVGELSLPRGARIGREYDSGAYFLRIDGSLRFKREDVAALAAVLSKGVPL